MDGEVFTKGALSRIRVVLCYACVRVGKALRRGIQGRVGLGGQVLFFMCYVCKVDRETLRRGIGRVRLGL